MTGIARQQWSGASDGDGNTALETEEIAGGLSTFFVFSTAGAFKVFGALDGTNYPGTGQALVDQHAVDNVPVTQAAASKNYAFYGPYRKIKITQVGATAVEGLTLVAIDE